MGVPLKCCGRIDNLEVCRQMAEEESLTFLSSLLDLEFSHEISSSSKKDELSVWKIQLYNPSVGLVSASGSLWNSCVTWLMAGARLKLIKKYRPVECLFTEEMGNVCVYCVYLDWSCGVTWADSAHKIHLSSLAALLDLQWVAHSRFCLHCCHQQSFARATLTKSTKDTCNL